ncbi:hypothetical protein BJ742DRAFT_827336 [Cladochytrium replicatum]|nr:hypothetical protein BJ742DRAFT_827336 [Cladochytrium replicatum]
MALRALITTKEAGVIICKNGKNVAEMREYSGAKITVSDLVPGVPGAHERVVTVSGPLDQIAKAFSLIATKIVEDQQTHMDVTMRELTMRILVPHTRMGQVIGKSGAQIKRIQDESGAPRERERGDDAGEHGARCDGWGGGFDTYREVSCWSGADGASGAVGEYAAMAGYHAGYGGCGWWCGGS